MGDVYVLRAGLNFFTSKGIERRQIRFCKQPTSNRLPFNLQSEGKKIPFLYNLVCARCFKIISYRHFIVWGNKMKFLFWKKENRTETLFREGYRSNISFLNWNWDLFCCKRAHDVIVIYDRVFKMNGTWCLYMCG